MEANNNEVKVSILFWVQHADSYCFYLFILSIYTAHFEVNYFLKLKE